MAESIKFEEAIDVFDKSLAVIVQDDHGTYIPYSRESWGEQFDEYVLENLIPSMYDLERKNEIHKFVNEETIHEIDFVLAWISRTYTEEILFFKKDDDNANLEIDYSEKDNAIYSIEMKEHISKLPFAMIPLFPAKYELKDSLFKTSENT